MELSVCHEKPTTPLGHVDVIGTRGLPPLPPIVVSPEDVVNSTASSVPPPRVPTPVYGGVGAGVTPKAKPLGQLLGINIGTQRGDQPQRFGGKK